MSNEADPFRIYLTTEHERLLKLHAESKTQYFDQMGNFKPGILSMDLRSIFHILTPKDNAEKEIYVYNSKTGIYENKGHETLKAKIAIVLGTRNRQYYANATIYDIAVRTYVEREKLTMPINLLPLKNGILDISKNPYELLQYSEKFYFTYQLPATFDPTINCPKFKKFLEQILPDEKLRIQVQEMFGWCLWRKYNHQAAFMLVGDGSNGKSTLLAVLRCLLNNNVTAADLQTICADKFAAADLYQKFANIAAEIPSKKLEDSEVFKSLTDGVTLVRAQHKYGQPFHFVNFAKLIFSANEVPSTRDKTYAFYRRWILIFFNAKFGDGGLPRDVNILEKITTPEELSGILKWALEGLKRLLEQGDFSFRASVAETEKQYERLSNPIGTFLSDYVEETSSDEDYISKDYLWAELLYYCEKNKLQKPRSKIQLTQEIRVHFENVEQKQRKVGGKERQHVWVNCRFSDAIAKLDYAIWVEELT